MPRLYFAAPLFSDAERAFNAALTERIEALGIEVFLPQRDGFEKQGAQRAERPDQQGAQRAERPDQQGAQRAERPDQQGAQRAERPDQQGAQRAERPDQQGAQRAERPDQQGAQRAERPDQQGTGLHASLRVEEVARAIFAKDRDEVYRSDILLFVLDGRVPDEGAAVELGLAYADRDRRGIERPMLGLMTDWRSAFPNEPLNAMLFGALDEVHLTTDSLLERLSSFVRAG